MSKFDIDYKDLDQKINKRSYKLSEVAHKLEKVAFDVVRFRDDEPAKLWQVQSADDGDYIIALYKEEEIEKTASVNNWSVELVKNSNNLLISYKGEPLTKIASSQIGVSDKDLAKVSSFLPKSLSNNKKLVKVLLNEVSSSRRQEVLRKFPELSE